MCINKDFSFCLFPYVVSFSSSWCLMSHCLPGSELHPVAWWNTLWFLYHVHDVCGAQSPLISDPRGIQPDTNISQGNIYH